jgi:hypothetical protein
MSLNILTINEVSSKIKRKDFDSTKRWLINKNIKIHKDGKQLFVYEIDVDVEIDKIKVKELQVQFPNSWQEIYKKISQDYSVYEMVIHSLGLDYLSQPSTKLRPINTTEKELYNKYKT